MVRDNRTLFNRIWAVSLSHHIGCSVCAWACYSLCLWIVATKSTIIICSGDCVCWIENLSMFNTRSLYQRHPEMILKFHPNPATSTSEQQYKKHRFKCNPHMQATATATIRPHQTKPNKMQIVVNRLNPYHSLSDSLSHYVRVFTLLQFFCGISFYHYYFWWMLGVTIMTQNGYDATIAGICVRGSHWKLNCTTHRRTSFLTKA